MGATSIVLIVLAEAVALSLLVIGILLLKYRHLRKLAAKQKARLDEALARLNAARQAPTAPSPMPESYNDKLADQILLTKDYHHGLGNTQDIALDLDPAAPVARRAAALRHALLIAEKEATSENETEINWDVLFKRYQQILSFNEDYRSDQGTEGLPAEIEQLKSELAETKRYIEELERFKAMYANLEERWETCKDAANEHFIELQALASKSQNADDFTEALESYHSSYEGMSEIISHRETGAEEDEETASATLLELRRLRSVAVGQHRIIAELQEQLEKSASKEDQTKAVEGLQAQVEKQLRFLQESETCIQLMENELSNAKREVALLRRKNLQLPKLKSRLEELESSTGTRAQFVDGLKEENRLLEKKLKLAKEAMPKGDRETQALRQELSALRGKYKALEEKWLDLKPKE